MKSKLKLIIMVILSMAILTGCGSKSPSKVIGKINTSFNIKRLYQDMFSCVLS